MTFWSVFFGVFAGIIAGVFINLAIIAVRSCSYQKKAIKNLKFEIDFNIKKIDSFLVELLKYRNKVNGDSLYNYFGYYSLTKVIMTTLVQMFQDRSIYKYLDYKEIGKLQTFHSYFSLGMEKYINDQVQWN